MSVDIPAQFVPLVQQSIASGRFESESAMVTESFTLLALRERERKLVEDGLDEFERGDYLEFDDAGLAQFFEDVKKQARLQLQAERRADV
jgi:Arc/MetJ-type ribon-helix-helix transcriptional regulator